MAPTNTELIHAYRRLLRAGLRAVQFSKPSRWVVAERLRDGFRDPNGTFDGERIRRTVWFLNAAAQERGLEHKILKNLCRVRRDQARDAGRTPWRVHVRNEVLGVGKKKKAPDVIKGVRLEHYDQTLAMLNESMGLCLR